MSETCKVTLEGFLYTLKQLNIINIVIDQDMFLYICWCSGHVPLQKNPIGISIGISIGNWPKFTKFQLKTVSRNCYRNYDSNWNSNWIFLYQYILRTHLQSTLGWKLHSWIKSIIIMLLIIWYWFYDCITDNLNNMV
jgi:hypothetical protein